MKSKTINLLESIQQNSITNVIDKVAEQFKSEIIEEYKASETKEMSTELENKITKALALEGVDSPEDWVADVCSVALDMTPTGEALAIKEDENTDIKGQLKQLGIKSIYVSDEHKRADEDELNKLGGLEYNYRLQRNPSKAHYYSYLSIKHETLGDIYISFDIKTNKIDTTGFPWNFIEKAMTPEIKEFVETNEEFFNNLLKSKELGTGINLNESEDEATERMENRYGMKESVDLKESDGPFSGVEFEKNVPHEMRFKEYNFVNINDLYWVTQQPFSLNQLNQFAEAFKNTKFSKAYVTVRDFSTYDFENDLSRNVFAIIDKYNDIIDPTGYVEAVKKEGWEKILEESEDIINEA